MKNILFTLALLVSFSSFGQTAEEYLKSGLVKAEAKDYKGAISDLTKAIELDPNYESAFLARGLIKFKLPSFILNSSGAINDISRAIDINPNSSSHYKDRALMKSNFSPADLNGALDDLTKAIEIDPNYPNAYIERGKLKQKLNDHSNAVVDFQRFIDLVPDYAIAYSYMADSFYALKDYASVISSYEESFNITNSPEDAYQIGAVKAELNDFIGAISWYTKSIDAAQNIGDDRFNTIVLLSFKYRGNCKEKTGNLNAACEDWKKAAELGDNDANEWVANQCN